MKLIDLFELEDWALKALYSVGCSTVADVQARHRTHGPIVSMLFDASCFADWQRCQAMARVLAEAIEADKAAAVLA